ncbi:hypothetical protein ZMO02_11680 [Zymomonas mobilis subsp. pomaceae]|uniref:Uncharacterized protein n=1 Tax=Zymomonas mobilis subsp. pomaceae (strain ATCC 29192 / DSM 22645 / JCM 10191 / CCUG 17912 / NBRC 13757 / NCIMB 11200 / NRRL B-4491 / Barker I) TaxID=579138 RepID=F8ESW9_ZYMMT|nr:hypothetical protein Zymop_0974 [Zymomonas mobilis subsp. pomaceae ATCC 29192]GEB89531.1 hypothetical protein ZMO02_11680 [Zymomonas mobilis subsp. pomaceae]
MADIQSRNGNNDKDYLHSDPFLSLFHPENFLSYTIAVAIKIMFKQRLYNV